MATYAERIAQRDKARMARVGMSEYEKGINTRANPTSTPVPMPTRSTVLSGTVNQPKVSLPEIDYQAGNFMQGVNKAVSGEAVTRGPGKAGWFGQEQAQIPAQGLATAGAQAGIQTMPQVQPFDPYTASEDELRAYLDKQINAAVQPTMDIYNQTYGGLESDYNQYIADLEAQKAGVAQPLLDLAAQQKAASDAQYQQLLEENRINTDRAVEGTARRFGMSGFGRSTIHTEAQYDLQRQAANVQNEINRSQLLENARIDAEVRGATQDQLNALDAEIIASKEKVMGLKQELAESEANLRLQAMQTGEASLQGIMETQLEQQAAEQEQLANYLKSQGLVYNPMTGEAVEDIASRAELLKTQAEIEKLQADTYSTLNPVSKYELKYNPLTGSTDVFDPQTGQIVSNLAFAGVQGGSTGGSGNVLVADNSTVKQAFYLAGKSKYGHGEGKRECGEAYNQLTDDPKGRAGSTYASKMALVTKQDNPQAGNGLIIPLKAYYKDKNGNKVFAGHIETVIERNGDQIKTVSYNRDGKGGQTIQTYSISELQSKYGDKWGFTDSTFKPQFQQNLAQISQPTTPQTSTGMTYSDYLNQGIAQGMFPKDAMEYANSQVQADVEKQRGASKESFDMSQSLSTRYKPLQDEVRTLEQGFAITKGFNVNTQNPYDDQALIFSFMKVLDPGSVVREGEFKTAQNNASLLETFGANWQNAAEGKGMLLPEQRKRMLNTMKSLYTGKRQSYDYEIGQAEAVGQQYGIDPGLYLTVPAGSYGEPQPTRSSVAGNIFSNLFGI